LDGNLWALLLIVAGIVIISNAFYARRLGKYFVYLGGYKNGDNANHLMNRSVKDNATGYLEQNYIFGGSTERIDYKNFKGGEVNCIFGSCELDLSSAEMADGVNILEINTVFGSTEICVPPHWNVEIKASPIFGNIEDKRQKTNFEVDENKTLIIKTSSIFGSTEIFSK